MSIFYLLSKDDECKIGMRKNIYLHIGWSKTATTTIQSGLEINQDVFRNNNFLVAKSGFDQGQHHNLAYQLLNISGHHYFNPKYGTLDDLKSEIKKSKFQNILISSEIFHNANLIQIKELHDLVGSLGEVKIIVYLRSPDEYLASMWIELVKKGMYKNEFDQYLKEELSKNIYLDVLDRWGEVFGNGNILVRRFNKNNDNRHVFLQFLETLGLSNIKNFQLPQSKNISPSEKEFEIIRFLFKKIDVEYYPKLIPGYFLLHKVMTFGQENNWNRSNHVNVLDCESVDMIWEKFSEENRQIAKSYLGQEAVFSKPMNVPSKSSFSFEDLNKIEMLDLFGFLLGELIKNQ